MTGIAALLRYPLPELVDYDVESSDSDSEEEMERSDVHANGIPNEDLEDMNLGGLGFF
jgi:hypothetical protein